MREFIFKCLSLRETHQQFFKAFAKLAGYWEPAVNNTLFFTPLGGFVKVEGYTNHRRQQLPNPVLFPTLT